ncbi:MAG TPA: ribosome rescue protein RqcH [Methanolinea sp.]|nr:ribosome rescue protein RqcH [Methanolinea sp.]HQK56766.1 ribosome rescue protein RqcH [Methanolinea sp.]
MATEKGMSGIDVRAAVTEWNRLLPLWVYKVYVISPGIMVIRLHGKEHARHQLLIEPGRRAHLTAHPVSPPKNPPAFAMLLRKYLGGGRVLGIRQHGIQRIITFDVGKHDRVYHLIIELFDQGNIVLCDDDYRIIQPFSTHRFREREVVAGAHYALPPEGPATSGYEAFANFLASDERDIVRALAVGAMLGGPYAEYIVKAAGIDKKTPASGADPAVLHRAVMELLSTAETQINPVIHSRECLPFPLAMGASGSEFSLFNQALDTFYPPSQDTRQGPMMQKEKVSREARIRAQQEAAVAKFNKNITRCERAVDAIYSNYPFVQDLLRTLQDARGSRSWQEIETILKSQVSGPATKVLAVYPDRAAVDVDLGERVTLVVGESVEANAARYYEEIKKFKRKIAGASTAMDRVAARTERKVDTLPLIKKRWYHRFRWFFTRDGVLVVGGRDASQNEELVKKYMEGGDLFVHADVHGASVVIVKGATAHMDEVATFAASYSGAWKSGHFSADVYSATPAQVSKTPESGEYVSRGSFIVRGERTYYRDVALGVAIGLQRSPETGVIGGPPSAVRSRASVMVELRPGRFEPNDTAKKVLRILKEKIPPDEQRGMKAVLNTEAVAAFVPPGGSDIVEGE